MQCTVYLHFFHKLDNRTPKVHKFNSLLLFFFIVQASSNLQCMCEVCYDKATCIGLVMDLPEELHLW